MRRPGESVGWEGGSLAKMLAFTQAGILRKRMLRRYIVPLLDAELTEEKDTSPHLIDWSLELGFFAIMGGFIVELQDSDLLTEGCTLTPAGVLLMAKLGKLPVLTRDVIMDKSKSDCWGRAFACLQVVQMLIGVVGRKTTGLHVTLLEWNVLAHVLCAALLFLVWWCKPKDIRVPHVI